MNINFKLLPVTLSIIVTDEGSNIASTGPIRSKCRVSTTHRNLCVIFRQPKKNRRDCCWRETLAKCVQIQPTALVNAARLRQHEHLMFHLESTGMEAVAADIMYHQSCYKDFTSWKIQQWKWRIRIPKPMLNYFLRWNHQSLLAKKLSTCLCCVLIFCSVGWSGHQQRGVSNGKGQMASLETVQR